MKDVYQLLEQKEADLARVRREIEGLRFIASMNRTTQAVQQELATWICSKCNHQYSRRAAECVDWICEDCEVPLLDASGQRFERKKATKPAAADRQEQRGPKDSPFLRDEKTPRSQGAGGTRVSTGQLVINRAYSIHPRGQKFPEPLGVLGEHPEIRN